VLTTGGVALLGALAGCNTVRGKPEIQSVRLTNLRIQNNHDQPHTVDVLMLESEEPIYLSSCTAEPFDDETRRSGGCPLEGFPTMKGEYRLLARDRDDPGTWYQLDFRELELDTPCIKVDVWFDFDGTMSILWHPC
jgi:hypothetical protein